LTVKKYQYFSMSYINGDDDEPELHGIPFRAAARFAARYWLKLDRA
jgi:hypothetical protein